MQPVEVCVYGRVCVWAWVCVGVGVGERVGFVRWDLGCTVL